MQEFGDFGEREIAGIGRVDRHSFSRGEEAKSEWTGRQPALA